MQYLVLGSDGNQYGPVDLQTLKAWVQEGRVTSTTQITDGLSNQTLMASQMPELGISSTANPYANTPAPPQGYPQYPRPDSQYQPQYEQKTRLWGILFWLGLAVVISMFTTYGGVIISGWNIFDAFQAKQRNDPKVGLCIGFAVGGFLLILLWTFIKYKALHPG